MVSWFGCHLQASAASMSQGALPGALQGGLPHNSADVVHISHPWDGQVPQRMSYICARGNPWGHSNNVADVVHMRHGPFLGTFNNVADIVHMRQGPSLGTFKQRGGRHTYAPGAILGDLQITWRTSYICARGHPQGLSNNVADIVHMRQGPSLGTCKQRGGRRTYAPGAILREL